MSGASVTNVTNVTHFRVRITVVFSLLRLQDGASWGEYIAQGDATFTLGYVLAGNSAC